MLPESMDERALATRVISVALSMTAHAVIDRTRRLWIVVPLGVA